MVNQFEKYAKMRLLIVFHRKDSQALFQDHFCPKYHFLTKIIGLPV